MSADIERWSTWLEDRLVDRGWRPADLARAIPIDPSQVSRWRKGEDLPTREHALRLAAIFNWDPNDVLGMTGHERLPEDVAARARLAAARRALRRYWMRWRRGLGDDPEGRWFLADDGEPLTAGGVHEMTTALGRRAGVWPSNPHRFRHSFAVRALRAGMSPFDVQLMLGHESLDMTKRYAKLATEDLQRAAERSSPLDRLRLGL